MKPFQREMLQLATIIVFELAEKLFQNRCIEAEVKRKNVRIGQTQCDDAPDSRQSDVVFERGIADVRHPVIIVVHRVIDAVVAGETEIDDRPAEMIEKYGVIGAAANTSFDERAVEWRT